jgi:hypothetical protein
MANRRKVWFYRFSRLSLFAPAWPRWAGGKQAVRHAARQALTNPPKQPPPPPPPPPPPQPIAVLLPGVPIASHRPADHHPYRPFRRRYAKAKVTAGNLASTHTTRTTGPANSCREPPWEPPQRTTTPRPALN